MNKYDSNILRLAVPSIVSNITVPLLGLVDIAIVGHMGGVGYIAAISVGTMAFNVMYWLLGFVRMSASGTTSQLLGARNLRGVVDSLACSMLVALSISLLLILFNVILFRGLMLLMSPTDEVTRLAAIYFDICIWGAPAVLGVNALSGWFVGMQDTRTPMVVAILQNVVNIALSAYLVFVVGMKVEGVAYGTLVAQWTGFALAVVLLVIYYARLAKYSDGLLRLLSRCKGMLGKYFAVNRDIFLRTVCIVGVNLFFTAAGARQGEVILSANTILMTFFTLFSYVMDGFAFAGEALAGKYFGASNRNTLISVCDRLFVWGWGVSACFTMAYLFGGHSLVCLLTDEMVARAAAMNYILWAVAIPFAGMAAFVYDGIYVGITASRQMLSSSVVATATFFAVYFLLFPKIGNHALWLALILYLAARGIVQKFLFHKIIS